MYLYDAPICNLSMLWYYKNVMSRATIYNHVLSDNYDCMQLLWTLTFMIFSMIHVNGDKQKFQGPPYHVSRICLCCFSIMKFKTLAKETALIRVLWSYIIRPCKIVFIGNRKHFSLLGNWSYRWQSISILSSLKRLIRV